jgi:sulfite reductase alpha subunit-like flavoprotein
MLLQPPWLLELQNDEGSTEDNVSASIETIPTSKVGSLRLEASRHNLDITLQENKRITPKDHWQDVRHLTFITPNRVNYLPGDILVIYPRNNLHDVDQIIDLMGWKDIADYRLIFSPNKKGPYLTQPKPHSFHSLQDCFTSLRELLTKHIDLNAIPRRSFFSLIAHFTSDEFQKTRLLEFGNPEFLDELYDYTTRPRRSILEVLQEFDTVKIPWQWVVAVFPTLRGRQFSIASGGSLTREPNGSTRIELLVAIVKYKTVIRKLRRGVCTRYLENLELGSTISATLQKGGLDVSTANIAQPMILIGPGTGVAPIRSLLWQRLEWSKQRNKTDDSNEKAPMGPNFLFFGCRNKKADYFFKDEWDNLKNQMLLDVFPAFSRDQDRKEYVQDVLRAQSQLIQTTICRDSGMVFVCGSSGKMPQAVREALIEAIEKESPMSREDAQAYLLNMEKNNRYRQETW